MDGWAVPPAPTTMACASTPLMLNEDAPRRAEDAWEGPTARGAVAPGASAAPTCGLSVRRCNTPGRGPPPASAAANRADTRPAAPSAWPRDSLDASRVRGGADDDDDDDASRPPTSAPTSMGSPNGVPVPCRDTAATSVGVAPAACSAAATTDAWAGPEGAVSPAARPARPTPLPAMSARGGASESAASLSLAPPSTTTNAPSARPYPSAAASSARHRPAGANAPSAHVAAAADADTMTLTPATREAAASREVRAREARCRATSDDEHAVSIAAAGPPNPNPWARRPVRKASELPVAAAGVRGAPQRLRRSP